MQVQRKRVKVTEVTKALALLSNSVLSQGSPAHLESFLNSHKHHLFELHNAVSNSPLCPNALREELHTQPCIPVGFQCHTASPGCAGREWSNRRGQAAPGVCCGGNDCHKVRFYPCRCEYCFISCATSSCMRQSLIAICHHSSPWLPIRPFT